MALLGSFIESTVARRIVGLFVVCALGPMLVLAVISYVQVSHQLRSASQERQHQARKNVGIDLVTRLAGLAGDLALAEATLAALPGAEASLPATVMSRLEERFQRLALVHADGSSSQILGEPALPPPLTLEEVAHLHASKTLLRIEAPARFSMIRPFTDSGARLVAVIEPAFLWRDVELAAAGMKVVVRAPSGPVLFSSENEPFTPPQHVAEALQAALSGELEWTASGSSQLGSYWRVPTAFEFLLPGLTILVSEERSNVLAPIVGARKTFMLVCLLSLWVVMLLSLVQVRRTLVPLNLLTQGAQRVGEGNLDTSVHVSSGDEFEALAAAFNAMTDRLQRQFQSLSARAALDRAVLSSLDADTIMMAALERLDSRAGDHACLVTFGRSHDDPVRAFISDGRDSRPRKVSAPKKIRTNEEAVLLRHGSTFVEMERDESETPTFLEPLAHTAWRHGVAFPIVIEGWPVGVLTVASTGADRLTPEDVMQLRQVTDQIAVALANARLVQALDRKQQALLNETAEKERQGRAHLAHVKTEQLRVVHVTMRTVQDIVNNCLNQLQLLRMDAEGHVAEESLTLFDDAIHETSEKLRALGDLKAFAEKQMEVGSFLDVDTPSTRGNPDVQNRGLGGVS
jgi:HAMP domain-containing protein